MNEKQKQIIMDLRALSVRMANVAINMQELYPEDSAALQETSLAAARFADSIVEGDLK